MTATHELATAIGDSGPPRVGFRQGTVIEFNTTTGQNIIDVGDAQLEDVPCLNVTDAAGLLPGMVVGLLTFQSSWWLLGRIAGVGTPDFGDLVIRGGELRVEGSDGSEVSFTQGTMLFRQGSLPTEITGYMKAYQAGAGRTAILVVPPRTLGGFLDNYLLVEGQTDALAGQAALVSKGDAFLWSENNVFLHGDNQFKCEAVGGNGFVDAGGGSVVVSSSLNQVFVDHDTTTNAANCEITSAGLLRRSTSSRRFKANVADADIDPDAVLRLRPRVWTDRRAEPVRPTPDEEPDPPEPKETVTHGVGFIAEELDEIGLGSFVTRDAEGNAEGIAYDRLSAALVPVLQRQQQQIDALTTRLDALERR